MQSCLYHGSVRHRRFAPCEHEFRYGVSLLYLDLAELEAVFAGRWLWSTSGPAPVRWRRGDHLGDPQQPLADCVRDLLATHLRRRPEGPIRLLTHPRYFGFGFNPVSFYYCYDRDGTRLEAIVAEINNTPWGEQHCYVLPSARSCARDGRLRFRFAKDFHVSPFMPMDLEYDWRFGEPAAGLFVHMENRRAAATVFDATMALEREAITTGSLARTLARHPAMTAKVFGAIHWQALRLWLKGVPVHTHPGNTGHRGRAGHIETHGS